MCSGSMDNDGSDSSLPRQNAEEQEYNNDGIPRSGASGDMSSLQFTRTSNWQSILSIASAYQEAINENNLNNITYSLSVAEARAAPHHLQLNLNNDRFAVNQPRPAAAAATTTTTASNRLSNQDIYTINALHTNTFPSDLIHYHDWPTLRSGYATLPRPIHLPDYGIHTTNASNINRYNVLRDGGSFNGDSSTSLLTTVDAAVNGRTNQGAGVALATRPDSAHMTQRNVEQGTQSRRPSSSSTNSATGYHVARLTIASDVRVLDRVHNFLRGECIEIFTVTETDEIKFSGGRSVHPTNVGQVGFRCSFCRSLPRGVLAKQANFFPSRRDTIFECVRNFKRSHIEACPCIPESTKVEYKRWVNSDDPRKKSHQYLRAYYAEAALEIGLTDDTNKRGLVFGGPPNTSGEPSARIQVLIQAAEHPDTPISVWKTQNKDQAIQMKKFEHVASAGTRIVLLNARRTPSDFVYPHDYPTVPDFDFLLLHQLCPIKPTSSMLGKKGLANIDASSLSGLCCKHCARANAISSNNFLQKGVYFPTSVEAMVDSSFSQTLLNHVMNCDNVPRDIKSSLDELKSLAEIHSVKTRRGIKRRFFEKIWGRITTHFKNDV
jgi:hypothetical protein